MPSSRPSAERRSERPASGPLGDPVRATYAVVPSASGPTAVIEMARASGLALIAPRRGPAPGEHAGHR